jgi:hypothetical protein
MENYTANIPALGPLAARDVNDSPARPILAGLPLNVEDIAAAQNQYTKRKHLHKANYATQLEVSAAKRRLIQVEMEHATVGAVGPVWAAGLQAALDNLTQVTNDTNVRLQALAGTVQALEGTVNDPNTGLQALARTVNDTNVRLQALEGTVNDPNTGLRTVAEAVGNTNIGLHALIRTVNANSFLMKQEHTRNMNRSAVRTLHDPITPIYHPNEEPDWSPRSYSEVLYCSKDEADIFIRFYDVNVPVNPTLAVKRVCIRNFLGISI